MDLPKGQLEALSKKSAKKPRRTEEGDTQKAIIDLCVLLGFLVFHDTDSRRNRKGFPDLVIVGYGKLIFMELKTDKNRTTPEQEKWLEELALAGVDARLYRTSEWTTGKFQEELQGIRREWVKKNRRCS